MTYFYTLPEGKKFGQADYQTLITLASALLEKTSPSALPTHFKEEVMGYTKGSNTSYSCIRVNTIVLGAGQKALKEAKQLKTAQGFLLKVVKEVYNPSFKVLMWSGVKSIYSCHIH
jgi:hypothetical protein